MKLMIKPAIMLGLLAGAALGLAMIIPYITGIFCFVLFTLVGSGIVFYLKRNSFIGIISLQDGALIGGLSGFFSFISASFVYIPIIYIISLFDKTLVKSGFSFNSVIIMGYNIFVIIMLIFFMALLSALFNSFSGLVVAYIYEKIENNPIDTTTTEFRID